MGSRGYTVLVVEVEVEMHDASPHRPSPPGPISQTEMSDALAELAAAKGWRISLRFPPHSFEHRVVIEP